MALARAFAAQKSCLIADEPTADLDETALRLACTSLRSECDQGAAVLLATHDDRVVQYCDQVYRLESGALRRISGSKAPTDNTV